MERKYPEYKQVNWSQLGEEVRKYWDENHVFERSLEKTKDNEPFVFYEGPPSANGQPGIHHVMARSIKDIFCRYKTLKGFHVKRKAGWDTHGLPVEIGVEKALGITKEDIGKKITVEEYNAACRSEVMKYKDLWDDLTRKMGYWVDLDDPYITFENKYIESVWYLLGQLYKKGLLYKGYTIQPYSPAAGTGLSTHELNQPGCYQDVKDTTAVAQFKVIRDEKSEFLYQDVDTDVFFLAWTTTPWTLPSNTALAVGPHITYVKVRTFNPYTGEPVTVILAKDLFRSFFNEKDEALQLEDYKAGDKKLPYQILDKFEGPELQGVSYEQLIPWVQPKGEAFRVILGDYVTTEDGTGVVHIAPTFGADDDRVAKVAGIAPLILIDKDGNRRPMVDLQGRLYRIEDLDPAFVQAHVDVAAYGEYAGRFVKNAYDPTLTEKDPTLDVDLAVMLKMQNKAFRIEKHTHNYPHCWRTDKPILYYPLDSWFIRTTEYKERMIGLNKQINWKPAATGTGRFGNWLENLLDWNLSRSRFWGTPLPIWRTEDGKEEICISSAEELKSEIDKAVAAGLMSENPLKDFVPGDNSKNNYEQFDLHRPYVDNIVLLSASGKPMKRELDLIDVWFDSGSMPYAQFHYPFENKETLDTYFPSDFIAEGVDQTRGWFFTLHAIGTMVFDQQAYKTVVSNGLVLDKAGNKMSKRLGNAVDPFATIQKYGPDATRWYMITNAQPWDNLKFDLDGVAEVQRKFFGTLSNTYSFFALYANIDGFRYQEDEVPFAERPEIDRWILSELNTLIKKVDGYYENFEPTKAGRAMQEFVNDHLSNWYVRLCRRRFWKGQYSQDKISAYQTLYRCLEVICQLASPIAPFAMERFFMDLNSVTGRVETESIHHTRFPLVDEDQVDKDLEERMQLAQAFSSMVLSLRKKHKLRVRQPLNRIMIPVLNARFQKQVSAIENLILSEVNVKSVEYLTDSAGVLVKKVKPNFKTLGPRYGKLMKQIAGELAKFSQEEITKLEKEGLYTIQVANQAVELRTEDVEILTEDIPGWVVATSGALTVALDVTLTDELKEEGLARELVNRIQNLRKDHNFEVTDKIQLILEKKPEIEQAIQRNIDYICSETLADSMDLIENLKADDMIQVELSDQVCVNLTIHRVS